MIQQREDGGKRAISCLASPMKLNNTLAPINKLPPEILGTIPTYNEGQTPKDLVTVSSVCSYWRNTFLATPNLWTKLDGKGIEKTRAWVERSGNLPIQLHVGGSPDPEVIEFLGTYSSRLESVDLPKLEPQDLPLFTHGHLSRLLYPNPLLHDICIEASDPETFDTPITIGGEFPSLEILRLFGSPVSIINLSAPNLRNLLLSGTHDLARILDLLDSLPLLESLALRLNLQQISPVDMGRKVVLGKMLQASFLHNGFTILQHLSLPIGGEVKMIEELSLDHLDGAENDYTHFLSRVLDDLPMIHRVNSISFHTSRSCRILLLSGPNGGLGLVTPEIGDTTACITLLRLFARHSTESLQDLTISNLHVHSSNTGIVSRLLKSLVNLRSLVMHQSLASPCLSALGTSHCLRLQDITVQRPSPWLLDYDGLMQFIQDRSEAGIPIRRIFAVNPFPTPLNAKDMETLRKHVKYVAWR